MLRTTGWRVLTKYLEARTCRVPTFRKISALYISGDKAKENYVTLQPYMDFAGTLGNQELEDSIHKRGMPVDLAKVRQMHKEYEKAKQQIEKVETERIDISNQLKAMGKSQNKDEQLVEQLKHKGKALRDEMKALRNSLYPVEDEFIQSFLNLPNVLHSHCPYGEHDRLLYRSRYAAEIENATSHLENHDLIEFIDDTRYYMMGTAAEFDIFATDGFTSYLRQQGTFIQTSNPDFVRLVLLEANATPMERYHKVMEAHLQNSVNCAYLTGGAAFESYLAAVTKMCVYPAVIPLKYVCNGRLYERTLHSGTPSLYTAVQTNAVQTFAACQDQQQAEEIMEDVLNLCVNFYNFFKKLNYRIVYVKASELTPSECLRAQIEVYSPAEKRFVCVGRISNFGDFVSKRILFTMRENNKYKFLHLVGGPVLYTSRLIAALIESGIDLDYESLLRHLNVNMGDKPDNSKPDAMEEFKALFK